MPVPDYLSQVQPLEATKTDTEIAEILNARTVVDILSDQVRQYMHDNDLWLTDPETGLRLAGSIGSAYSGLTAPQKLLLQKLHDWIYNQDSIETENDDNVAVLFFTIISGMVPLGMITVDQGNAIYAIGGGRPLDGIVIADIVASRNANAAIVAELQRQQDIETLRAEIENTWINPAISDGVTLATDLRATIKAGL